LLYGPEETIQLEGVAWNSGPIGYRAMVLMKAVAGHKRSQFYSFMTHIWIGEIDYAVEPCKEDYKNTPSRDWLDSSFVFLEKETPLLLSQRE
jgi:hypothetical protein